MLLHDMDITKFQSELDSLGSRWNKLLFVNGISYEKAKEMASQIHIPYINLNLVLSEKLMEIPKSKYPLQVMDLIEDFLENNQSETYWIGDIEILFDQQLQQNPVRLLENIGKRYKLVVTWSGEWNERQLSYATPDHPEYFTCHETDGKIVNF